MNCNCSDAYGPVGSLQNIIDKVDLRWIFVTGRAGGGKTTCSCALAVQLSKERAAVLLVSTYAPHNLSDVFEQKFSIEPTIVHGFDNLYAMELDEKELAENKPPDETDAIRQGRRLARFLLRNFHGIDEAIQYAAILKAVKEKNISVVVFDTISPDEIIGLMAYLHKFENELSQLFHLKLQFSQKYSTDTILETHANFDYNVFSNEMDKMLHVLIQICFHFKNTAETTLIYVDTANPSYFSENKALFNRFAEQGIRSYNIVVNKLTHPGLPHNKKHSKQSMEATYLKMLPVFYKYLHVTKLPLMNKKPTGVIEITSFAEHLLKPCFIKH